MRKTLPILIMMYEKIKQMREASGKTLQEIADESHVPLSTVARIISGQTDCPQFQTVAAIVSVLGGSLDELAGIKLPAENDKAVIEQLRRQIEEKNRWLLRMFVFCCALIGAIGLAILWDILTPTGGYIKY